MDVPYFSVVFILYFDNCICKKENRFSRRQSNFLYAVMIIRKPLNGCSDAKQLTSSLLVTGRFLDKLLERVARNLTCKTGNASLYIVNPSQSGRISRLMVSGSSDKTDVGEVQQRLATKANSRNRGHWFYRL